MRTGFSARIPPPFLAVPGHIKTAFSAMRVQLFRRLGQAWILLIIAGSLQNRRFGTLMALHRQLHWAAFAGAAFFLLLPIRTLRQALRRIAFTFLLGLSLEYLQHVIYHKPMEWVDVGDDALASLAGFAVYWLAVRRTPANAVQIPR